MTLAHLFRHQNIGGKDVYVVDDYHRALAPWALVRHQLGQAPNLITIDHLTDVYEAFLGHAHLETYESRGDALVLGGCTEASIQASWHVNLFIPRSTPVTWA
jgi:hypothetical protein